MKDKLSKAGSSFEEIKQKQKKRKVTAVLMPA